MVEPTARPRRLAPSDLQAAPCGRLELREADGGVEISGRVLSVSGSTAVLADAFAMVELTIPADVAISASDLVVLAGEVAEGRFIAHRVVERHRPHGVGARETERFTARGVGGALRARAAIVRELRAFFDEERFVEVETPLVVPSPGLDLHLDALDVPGQGHLITSPEYQMKRLLVGGVPRCFQVCRCFRRGEVGRRHNPEFTMVEWYRAFADVEAVMADTEAMLRRAARVAGAWPSLHIDGTTIDLEGPFERLPVADAFARWAGVCADEALAMAVTDEDRFFRLLVDAVEPALAGVPHPVFLVEYPAPFASLARLSPRDPRVAERFELHVAGVELCNGFGELTDPIEQRARLARDRDARRSAGKAVYPIDERFLDALEEGMPPSAGNALGLDRLVAVCLGTDDIREVTAFPAGLL